MWVKHYLHYLSIRHESSFDEQPLLSEISLFLCSTVLKIYIKGQRNKKKRDSYCELLEKKSSQIRSYIHNTIHGTKENIYESNEFKLSNSVL